MERPIVMIEHLLLTKQLQRCLNYVQDSDIDSTYLCGVQMFLRCKIFHDDKNCDLDNPYFAFLMRKWTNIDEKKLALQLNEENEGIAYFYLGCLYSEAELLNIDQAILCFQMAVERGITNAKGNLAAILIQQTKFGEALTLLETSLENPLSLLLLGHCYLRGYGVAQDIKLAISYYQKSIALMYDEAYYSLALLLMNSDQTQYGPRYWLHLMDEAAKKGHTQALLFLIQHYEKSDKEKQLDYLVTAAIHGDCEMKYLLGYHYFHGLDLPKDIKQAQYWLQFAIDGGNKKAKQLMKKIVE